MKLSFPIFRLRRQARLTSREAKIPLAMALDQIARREGFRSWSLLAQEASRRRPVERILAQTAPGDLVLLAARPGHGKTLLGIELAVSATLARRDAFFFTLEETEAGVSRRLRELGIDAANPGGGFMIDTSDAISADYVISRLHAVQGNALVVIDYLQLLDQQRQKTELAVQVRKLHDFARDAGATIIALSQVDRSFEQHRKTMPGPSDVRLPNPVDLDLFSHACFLHDGKMHLQRITAASQS